MIDVDTLRAAQNLLSFDKNSNELVYQSKLDDLHAHFSVLSIQAKATGVAASGSTRESLLARALSYWDSRLYDLSARIHFIGWFWRQFENVDYEGRVIHVFRLIDDKGLSR